MKNKILIVSTKAITINQFFTNLINDMLEKYDIELACSNPKEINFYKIKKHKLFFPLSILQLINPFLFVSNLYKNRKFLKNNNFKSIIINTPVSSHFLRLSSIGLKVDFIYFVHGYRFHSKGSNIINILNYFIEKFLSHLTNKFININYEDYIITKNNFKKNNILIKGVGIDINVDKKKIFCENGNLNIIYIGAFKKSKGYYELIKLAKKLKNFKKINFYCYGYGETKKIKNTIISNNLNNIKIFNFEQNLKNKLISYDLLISFSYREGLPVSGLECMIRGIPIIANNIRGFKDIIDNNINGFLINNNSINEFYEKIIYFYENKEIINSFSNQAIKKIDKTYSHSLINKRIIDYIISE